MDCLKDENAFANYVHPEEAHPLGRDPGSSTEVGPHPETLSDRRHVSHPPQQLLMWLQHCWIGVVVQEVCQALVDELMSLPRMKQNWKTIAVHFQEQWNVPCLSLSCYISFHLQTLIIIIS